MQRIDNPRYISKFCSILGNHGFNAMWFSLRRHPHRVHPGGQHNYICGNPCEPPWSLHFGDEMNV